MNALQEHAEAPLEGKQRGPSLVWLVPLLALLTVELVNSAIEAIVDRIGNEFNELSGRAKDLGSAAVFVCLLASAVSWLAIAFQNLRGEPMT